MRVVLDHRRHPAFAAEALGYRRQTDWVRFSVLAYPGFVPPSGIAAPSGEWAAGAGWMTPSLAIVDVEHNPGEIRPWRRMARAGIYEPHVVNDPRRGDRDML